MRWHGPCSVRRVAVVTRQTAIKIPWSTLLKIICAAALVWLWLQLYQIVLLLAVAILLAVTLNPAVKRIERLGLPRWLGAVIVSVALLALVVGFLWMTWSSLSDQARLLADQIGGRERELMDRLPGWMRESVRPPSTGDVTSYAAPYALSLAQSTTTAIAVALLGFVLMIYLLIEGRETCDWLLAFVPRAQRAKAEKTLVECERVMIAYAVGNTITSIIAFAFTLVVLSWLQVPAALLLALMAGLSDFVPVLGFIVSSIPAILLGLSVSVSVALMVVAAYIFYNTVESYIITPWAYGERLKLSNVAVILAFAAGAEIAGVIGALIALPVAAIYPSIERIWLRDKLAEDTVREHKAIESKAG
jgi:predicted PurR-regulated permease PerM